MIEHISVFHGIALLLTTWLWECVNQHLDFVGTVSVVVPVKEGPTIPAARLGIDGDVVSPLGVYVDELLVPNTRIRDVEHAKQLRMQGRRSLRHVRVLRTALHKLRGPSWPRRVACLPSTPPAGKACCCCTRCRPRR